MAGIRVTSEEYPLTTLNSMADGVVDGVDRIKAQADAALEAISQYPVLGSHAESIKTIVALIREEANNSTAPARTAAEKLREKAKQYQDWINEDMFSVSGN